MRSVIVGAAALAALSSSVTAQSAPSFTPTKIKGHFVEQFTSDWADRWSPSKATKEEKAGEVFSYVGKWSVEEPTVYPGISGDEGLVLKTKAAHHAISVPFDTPLDPKAKTLVVQYEVKLQKLLECGGAYIKLLTADDKGIQAEEFSDKTPYTIMFGPDRCGSTSKVHFIFRHKSPLTGAIEEKHLVSPPSPKITKTSALYTLIVRPNQTYEIKINNESVKSGSLLEDFSPSVNPPKEIDDETDEKPTSWVEDPKIPDPEATKPLDWNEDAPRMIIDEAAERPADWLIDEEPTIPDPDAEKPEEWSDEDDGDWIAPSIPNPACEGVPGCGPWTKPEIPNPEYKGKWFAPLIDNPEYKGVWAPRKIPNPDYYEDNEPANFNQMAGIGIELWSMTEDILFDNIYVGDSEKDASAFATETFLIKKPIEDALEEADKPATPPVSAGEEPDYKTAPVAWAKFKYEEFLNVAVADPVAALKAHPGTAGVVAAGIAALISFLSLLIGAILPSGAQTKAKAQQAKDAVAKKTDAVTADVKDAASSAKDQVDDALNNVDKDAPLAEKKDSVASTVKTRKGKAAAADN